jgi:hypothetical protein
VTLDDQLVQVIALLRGQTAEPNVIEDDQIRGKVASEYFVVGAVRSCLAQVSAAAGCRG